MSKHYIDEETGEFLDSRQISRGLYVDKRLEMQKLRKRFKNCPESLSLDELYLLRNRRSDKVQLQINEIGWVSSTRQKAVHRDMTTYSLALLLLLSDYTSFGGRLIFDNGRYVHSIFDLLTKLGFTKNEWYRYIRNDFKKHRVIVYEKIGKERYILVNPLYVHSHRWIDESTFIAFHEDIEAYLDPVDYYILQKRIVGRIVNFKEV